MSDTENFRFVRSPTGDIYRMFERHKHDRKWQPVSDFEAYEFFKAAGADLVELGLDGLGEMAEAIRANKSAKQAQTKRTSRGLKPAAPSEAFGSDDLLAGLNFDTEQEGET